MQCYNAHAISFYRSASNASTIYCFLSQCLFFCCMFPLFLFTLYRYHMLQNAQMMYFFFFFCYCCWRDLLISLYGYWCDCVPNNVNVAAIWLFVHRLHHLMKCVALHSESKIHKNVRVCVITLKVNLFFFFFFSSNCILFYKHSHLIFEYFSFVAFLSLSNSLSLSDFLHTQNFWPKIF